ncbi:hypothetical protein [Aquipseudomonas campi]
MSLMLLQLSYAVLGGIMNIMSLLHYRNTARYYTPTGPVSGLMMMAMYALCVPLQRLEWQLPFQVMMVIFVVLLGAGGVLKHLVHRPTTDYASATARWAAIMINGYGVALSVYALAGN